MRRSIVSKLLLCGVILLSNTSPIKATELSTAASSLQAVTANQISVTESGSSEIFSYPNFSDLSGLTLVAAATQVNNKLRITPAKPDQVGAVWYGQPVFVRTNFVTSFAFQITEPGGGNDPDGNPGADGFAFVLQNHSATIVGAGGGAIGYGNIPNSVAIEFDTWNNGPDNHNGDPNGNHISVHTRGGEPNSSDHAYALGATTIIPNLSDGVVHHATIRYSSGRLEIAVDNLSQPVLSIPLDLATTLKLDDGKAWVGFSAATGVYENHDILSWSFQGNTAPQVQNVIINPTSPTDQADLALSYAYTDTENNPEDKSLTQIRWYRNSLLQPAFNNQMVIPQNVTYLGEEWCVTVRPHDGIVYGLTTVPTCVVIEPDSNHLPEASNLQIAPTAPTDDDNLLLSYDYSDPDADAEAQTQIFWYRDGVLQPAFNNTLIVSATVTVAGETWQAAVRPHDGKNYGLRVTTNPVTIIASVNTPPQVTGVFISPTQPGDDDHLELSYTYLDVDGDLESNTQIIWYRNSRPQSEYAGMTLIPSHATAVNDVWFATVAPNDGKAFGELVSAQSVQIVPGTINTPPQILDVFLAPEHPGTDENLNVFYTYYDADTDPEGPSTIDWMLNGLRQSSFDNQTTVPAIVTALGQTWCVVVTPHDGKRAGNPANSNCVTIGDLIQNGKPEAKIVYIDRPFPASIEALHLRYDYFDPDGDPQVNSQIRWYKDGMPQATFNDVTVIPSEVTNAGETWYATIRPHDGLEYGTLVTAEPVRINHPPQLDSVILSEVKGGLNVSYTDYRDIDGLLIGPTNITWFRNEIPQPSFTNLEQISDCNLNPGDQWFVTAAPYDGIEYGQAVRSNLVTITTNLKCLFFPSISRNDPPTGLTSPPTDICHNENFSEDNDIRAQACRLLPGETYVAYPDDVDDLYYFLLEQTSSVKIRVMDYKTVDAGQLQVITDPTSKVIGSISELDGTKELPNQSAPYALKDLPPGKYYVRIYTDQRHVNSTNLYKLSIDITPSN